MQAFFLGLATIVVTSILTTMGTLWVAKSSAATVKETATGERERHARYLAIRVVCVLDDFAMECGVIVGDDGLPDAQGYRHARVSTPEFIYPTDVDWKSIDPDLMYGLLSFPNEIGRADRDIAWVWENDAFPPDFEEAFEVRIRRYGEIGLRAIDLMESLQGRYGIVPRPDRGWSNRQYIEDSVRRSNQGVPSFVPPPTPPSSD